MLLIGVHAHVVRAHGLLLQQIKHRSFGEQGSNTFAIGTTTLSAHQPLHAVADGNHHGSIGGIAYSNPGNKLWAVLNSLGSIGEWCAGPLLDLPAAPAALCGAAP